MLSLSPSKPVLLAFVLLVASLVASAEARLEEQEKRQLASTAGVPATPNVGTGAPTATFSAGLGGLSTGSSVQFTPGAASSAPAAPFIAPTDAAGSASLASILTHFSQGMTAPTPTTGAPTGISSGLEGGFTGTGTSSVLDGRVTTIPNAATTYTGPRDGVASGVAGGGAANGVMSTSGGDGKVVVVALVAAAVAGGLVAVW